MLSLSVLYGMLSALIWGAGDFAGGLASRKLDVYRAVFYADLIGLLALIVIVLIRPEEVPPFSAWMLAGLAGMLGSVGLLTLYYSMTKGQMSIAAPVSALFAGALPVIVSAITQGLPTLTQFIGFIMALTAVWLISQGDASGFHLERLSDLRIPLLAGLGFGSYFILMNYATEGVSSNFWPMIASRTAGTLMLLVFVLRQGTGFSIPRNACGVVFANGMFDVAGNFFYILALRTGRLDIAAILSSLYPGATVILAGVFLKERISRLQWVGILCALTAIALFSVRT